MVCLTMMLNYYSHIRIQESKTFTKLNKYTISDFINKLSNESWDTIFNSDDINAMFNSFEYLFNDHLFQLPSKKSTKWE